MSDEPKKSGKTAGSIAQWGATLGAPPRPTERPGVQESEHSDAQASNPLDTQELELPDAQALERSNTQESERSDAQASNPLDAQVSELPSAQPAKRSNAKAPKRSGVKAASGPGAQASKRLAVQEASSPNAQASKSPRNKQTVYLEVEVDSWIRHRVADTREEISDVINQAMRQFMTK